MPVMLDWAEYTKFFLALIVIVNPVGAVPLFVSMTEQHTRDEKQRIARVASSAVAVVLILAAVGGQPLLAFFGITIASFKVGGAILILLLAISMMHATPTGEKQTPEEAREAADKESIAVVPLAIPLLAGPGAISTTIIYCDGPFVAEPYRGHHRVLPAGRAYNLACAARGDAGQPVARQNRREHRDSHHGPVARGGRGRDFHERDSGIAAGIEIMRRMVSALFCLVGSCRICF